MLEDDRTVSRVDEGVGNPSFHFHAVSFGEHFSPYEVPVDFHHSRVRLQGSVHVLFRPYRARGIRTRPFVDVALLFDGSFEDQILPGDPGIDSSMVDDLFADADGVRFRIDVHVSVHRRDEYLATALVDDPRARSGRRREVEILGNRRFDDGSSDVHARGTEFAGNFF